MTNRLSMAGLLIAGLSLSGNVTALVITPTAEGSLLANTILGTGVSISNVTYTGAANASGTFTGGLGAGLGFDSGIILTSGNASLAPGPNTSDAATGNNGLGGDADLNGLIPGFTTYDATVLEFDFQTQSGNLFFPYVFASEEYNEFVGSSFNDVFGFFVDGGNIATIPGTNTPVAINNLNCGNPFADTGPNCALFNNNDPSDSTIPFDLQYDGFTEVLTAQVLGLTPGLHHIKLAIADAGDSMLDSAIFLQGGAFSSTPPEEVPEPTSLALMGLGLAVLGLASRWQRVTPPSVENSF